MLAQEVKVAAQSDLRLLGEQAGFRLARHGRNKYHCACSQHKNGDKHPSASLYKGRFRCHTSNQSWDAIDLARWINGSSTGDAIRWLAARYGITPKPVRMVPKPEYVQARTLATQAVDIRVRARKALILRLMRLQLVRLKLTSHLRRVNGTNLMRWRAVDDRIDDQMRLVESALVTVSNASPIDMLAAEERLERAKAKAA